MWNISTDDSFVSLKKGWEIIIYMRRKENDRPYKVELTKVKIYTFP